MLINKKVADLLNKQINLELFSAYLYLEVANYFTDEGYDGFANWFDVQVKEELAHADLIIRFLRNNDVPIELNLIDDPSRDYKNHILALEEVFSHEQFITKSINEIYAKALEEKDFRCVKFLDWFIEEQGEEEKNANDLITKYTLFGKEKNLYLLDQELGTRIYTPPTLVIE